MLIDNNFKGVLKEYAQIYYEDDYASKSCKIINDTKKPIVSSSSSLSSESVIYNTADSVTSALQYSKEIEVDVELLEELVEIEDEAIAQIEMHDSYNAQAREDVVMLFIQYSKVLNIMFEFQELAFTLNILTDLLQNSDIDTFDEKTKKAIIIYIKAIIDDLHMWHQTVFIDKSAEDIHYLDKTLLSSIVQLEIMLLPQEAAEEEIEFF